GWPLQPDTGVLGHLADITLAQLLQATDEVGIAAVNLVEGHPAMPQAATPVTQQFKGQLRLGAEDDPLGHARGTTAGGVVGPGVMQIQARIEQGMAAVAGVSDVDGDLTVVEFAGGAAVLAGDADALGAAFGEGALIEDEDTLVAAEFVGDPGAELLAQG